jgi:hypothetical protein
MSDHQIFNSTINKDGYKYYVVPKGYPLFKALKTFRDPTNNISLTLNPNKPYFFGLKSLDPNYIVDYEEEYGVIFEFITTSPIELLALDDLQTISKLYKEAPKHIQVILEKNYGLRTKSRLSEAEPDRIFSNYLCELGLSGYAIYEMDTDFGGKFHPELLICNATNYVQYVKQITTSQKRIQEIIEMGKLKQMSNNLEQSRKEARKKRSPIFQENNDAFKPRKNLFDDDTPELNGGKNRIIKRKTNKRKTNKRKTNKRKTNKRKTNKRKTNKRKTNKRRKHHYNNYFIN